MSAPFPFSAIVGQDGLREALLTCAVDPRIGGVLVRGERGTAKSTAVRALAPLLPPVRVVEECAFAAEPGAGDLCPDGPHASAAPAVERPVRLVELPLGATADRLVGTLDLDRALADGTQAFAPGLLAAAHRGILYVDEVNLLSDHLVDVLLDAAALGHNHVERDGVSVEHPARFVLVGTMNPEEGELRPQLLDRFGLSVEVRGSTDQADRMEVVRRRLAHDADPDAFAARFAGDERGLVARVAAARARLGHVRLGDRALALITATCASLGVDGLRADIVCARTATALAALDGALEVDDTHVRRGALLALAHRRRRGPLETPGLAPEELDDAIEDARRDAPAGNGRPAGAPSSEDGPDDDGPDGGARHRADSGGDRAGEDRAPQPAGGLAGATTSGGVSHRPAADAPPGADAPAPERRDRAGEPGRAPVLRLPGAGAGAPGRRSRGGGRGAQPVDSQPPIGAVEDLSLAATLHAAARRRSARPAGAPLVHADLREHVRCGREGNLVVFCVDASGSMGARRRMAAVKGAIVGVLLDAYQRRDRVALVTFRGAAAQLVLAPTASVERAAAVLDGVATGGATPVAAGLERAGALVAAERRRDPDRRSLVLVVTDGRASGGPAGRAEGERAAGALGRVADGVVVFDAEQGAVRLGLAGRLAAAAGARLLPLTALDPLPTPAPARKAAA